MICDDDLCPEHSPQRQQARVAISRREAEILAAIANGDREKVIGHRIGIRQQSVSGHMHRICAKIGAKTTPHAVAMWSRGEIEVRQS